MTNNVKTRDKAKFDVFVSAVHILAEWLGAEIEDDPMPISKFKSNYSSLLREALSGHLKQISRGRERYVVLTEDQVIAMAGQRNKGGSLADTIASIATPTAKLDTSGVLTRGSMYEPYSLENS